ncbi:LuxR C-terminal-related transcriptional regulator [Streptomyces virginiae]|uniref:helix-turn-helix transcriptional regulator n=1 Tax=Streptomyces virginiae TaxID=1961 RepID=UPI00368E4FB7
MNREHSFDRHEVATHFAEGDENPLESAHHTRLIGRDEEMGIALRILNKTGRYHGLILSGGSGLGKTRMAEDIAAATITPRRIIRLTQSWAIPVADSQNLHRNTPVTANQLLRLFSSTADGTRPLILADDAHLLDAATADLLLELTDRRTVDLLMTVDLHSRCARAIKALKQDHRLFRIELKPLGHDMSRRLAASLLNGQLSHASAFRFAAMSAGNAQLLRELVRASSEQGMLTKSADGLQLSAGIPWSPFIEGIINQQLEGLSEHSNRALDLLAVAESPSLAYLEETAATSTLLQLEDRGLIETLATRPSSRKEVNRGNSPRVRLSHPLMGHFLRYRLPELKQRSLILSWIEIYERHSEELDTSDQLRLIEWRLQTSGAVGVNDLICASQRAHEAHDLNASARFGKAAWILEPSAETASCYARTLISVGDFDAADNVLASVAGDRELRGIGIHGRILRGEPVRVSHLPKITEQDHLNRIMALYFQGHFNDALQICTPWLDSIITSIRLDMGVFGIAALCHLGRPVDALDLYRKVDGARRGEIRTSFHSDSLQEAQAIALASLGSLDKACQILSREYETAATNGYSKVDARRGVALGRILLELGRPQKALELSTLTSDYDPGWEPWRQQARAQRVLAAAVLPGQLTAQIIQELHSVEVAHNLTWHSTALAWAAYSDGDQAEAVRLLTHAIEVQYARGSNGDVAILIHEMARLGISEYARPYLNVPVQGAFLQARVDICRSIESGDPALLERSATVFSEAGAALYAAEAFSYLSHLHQADQNDRAATAARLRAASLVTDCEGAVSPALQRLHETQPLSARERQIARLAAQGLRDKEIAERLVLSERTVSNHLYRTYRKLGVENRRELQRLYERT